VPVTISMKLNNDVVASFDPQKKENEVKSYNADSKTIIFCSSWMNKISNGMHPDSILQTVQEPRPPPITFLLATFEVEERHGHRCHV
jgi:hypothetical protein